MIMYLPLPTDIKDQVKQKILSNHKIRRWFYFGHIGTQPMLHQIMMDTKLTFDPKCDLYPKVVGLLADKSQLYESWL